MLAEQNAELTTANTTLRTQEPSQPLPATTNSTAEDDSIPRPRGRGGLQAKMGLADNKVLYDQILVSAVTVFAAILIHNYSLLFMTALEVL